MLTAGGGAATGILTLGAAPAEAQVSAAARRRRGPFTAAELATIIDNAVASAQATNSPLRSIDGTPRTTKMHIAVVDREGALLAFESMADAWEGSRDIAIAKARTAAFFSSDENALTSRIVGELSEPHANDGSGGAGPLWGIWASNQVGITGGASTRNGIITFPGGIPRDSPTPDESKPSNNSVVPADPPYGTRPPKNPPPLPLEDHRYGKRYSDVRRPTPAALLGDPGSRPRDGVRLSIHSPWSGRPPRSSQARADTSWIGSRCHGRHRNALVPETAAGNPAATVGMGEAYSGVRLRTGSDLHRGALRLR